MEAIRKRGAAVLMVALMLTFGTAVPPVAAQGPNAQAGLVNVNVEVTRVVDDVTVVVQDVNVAVAAAANIIAQVCGTNIGVSALIAELEQFGAAVCDNADTGSSVVVTQN
jgi:hypothetical protein